MLFQGSHVDSDLISTKAHNSTYDLLYVHCQYPNDFYIFTAQSSFKRAMRHSFACLHT